MTEVLTITIQRGNNSMATSFLIWGAFRRVPQADGDGTFVGEIEIGPDDESVSTEWTTPNNQTDWRFICAAKYNEIVGVFSQLETV